MPPSPSLVVIKLRLRNCVAATAVIALALAFYHVAPFNRAILGRLFGSPSFAFTGAEFLFTAAFVYAVLVSGYFAIERQPEVSKSLRFWQLAMVLVLSPRSLWMQHKLDREDRVAVLATLLKALFGPLMGMALMTATMSLLANFMAIAATDVTHYSLRELFDLHGFWFMFHLIVIADVLVYTVGYLVEMPQLGNRIRSVDPTMLGWVAALICYAPFNIVVGTFLGAPGSEFPRFENSTLHFAANSALLILMAVYTSASLALGFKASNLTHRGIVARGPYRYVRHPAYACKNMAWWIGSVPLAWAAFEKSFLEGAVVLASVVGWTLLYVLRAVTEEDHLRGVDGDYAAYATGVRYRFIPGLI